MKKNMIKTAVLGAVLGMMLTTTSCSMIPEYLQPTFSASTQWNDVDGYEAPIAGELATAMQWDEFFESKELHIIVDTALKNNKDLETAVLNIEEARALYRIERSDLLPSLNVNAGANYQRTPDAVGGNGTTKTDSYQANVGLVNYEIDLFGKVRSKNKAALNSFLATKYAATVVRNSLIAEAANAYLQLLADQKLLSLTQKTLKAQQRTYDILSKSLEKGILTEQDVARVATAVETAKVNLHLYKRLVKQDQNALFVLMGIPYQEGFLPETNLDEIEIRQDIYAGIPSEVLLTRPDVVQAEYELKSKNADIGAARAAFFPSISLTGNLGYASDGLSNLFGSSAAGAWSFVPQLTLPIFTAGRNKANLDIAEIRKEKAVVSYEKTIQKAFQEVSDALIERKTLSEQLKAQKRLVRAARKVYDISQARYKSGIDSFLSVLDSQRELYTSEQDEIKIERQRLSNLVNLYKALGGGTVVITE